MAPAIPRAGQARDLLAGQLNNRQPAGDRVAVQQLPNGTVDSEAVIAADLDVADVVLDEYTTMVVEPDSTPTVIGPTTTAFLSTTPKLTANLFLHNGRTVYFGINGYFSCATCSLVNDTDATMRLYNADGNSPTASESTPERSKTAASSARAPTCPEPGFGSGTTSPSSAPVRDWPSSTA